ncbi:MAG: energy transducer TonB [Bacteroidetes bacterium]|nr:energy transducer TonB [Bacteroidota bacterium]
MAQKSHTAHLFNESACLKLEALQDYSIGKLSSEEEAAVKNHLSSCTLCSEALEGLALIDDQQHLHETISSLKEQVTEHANARPRVRLRHIQVRSSRRIWVYFTAAAACIIILIGFFSLYFRLQKTSQDNLAALHDSIQVSDNKMLPESSPPVTSLTQISESAGKDALAMISPDKEKGTGGSVKTGAPVRETAENRQDISNGEAAITQPESSAAGVEREMVVAGVSVVQPSESIPVSLAETNIRITDSSLVLNMESQMQKNILNESGNALKTEEPSSKIVMYEIQQDAGDQSKESNAKREKGERGIYTSVDQMPSFPGDVEALFTYLSDSLHYPRQAIQQQIEGIVIVSFIVNADGSLSDIKIEKGLGAGCNDEAIRLVKSMPAWIPGMHHGKKVKVLYNLPIKFDLQ